MGDERMARVAEEISLAKALYSGPQESHESSSKSSDTRRVAVMVALWKRLGEFFGQAWFRQYGEADGEPIKAWTDALKDFTEEQIARGVKHCRDWRKDFPPNLGQFRELCLTVRPEEIKPFKADPPSNTPLLERLKGSAKTPIARREFAHMEAIAAGRKEYEFEGKTYPVVTFEEAYRERCAKWWGHLSEARF